jgi:U3 small nucleolar RNA-associated protein 24
MGVRKKTRKFAQVKRIIGQRDARLKKNQDKGEDVQKKAKGDDLIREMYYSYFLSMQRLPR